MDPQEIVFFLLVSTPLWISVLAVWRWGGPWLRPILLAPWLSMTTCITVGVTVTFFFGQFDPMFGGLGTWLLGILAGSVATVSISAALMAVDLVRVMFGTPLPVGIRAWAGGVLAFAITLGGYVLLLPVVDGGFLFGEALDFCIMVLGAIAVGAISARLVFSDRAKIPMSHE